MADIESTLDYYENLLIIQYNQLEKARGTIRALVESVVADGVFLDVRDGYDLDNAIGVQLDTLGEWVGIDRFYNSSVLDDDYFGFADAITLSASANIVGFDDASSITKAGFFLDASEVISNELRLNDETYRTLIKLKIVQNNSDHGFGDISSKIYTFFGDSVLVKDNYNMSMTYFIGDTSSALISAALNKGVLPRPAGVRLEAIDGILFFGFADADNLSASQQFAVGFEDASLGFLKDGEFLNSNTNLIS